MPVWCCFMEGLERSIHLRQATFDVPGAQTDTNTANQSGDAF